MGAYEAIKDAFAVARQFDNIELIQKLTEVQGELLRMTEEVRSLSEENARLRTTADLREQLEFDESEGVYFRIVEEGRRENYCPRCWVKDNKAARLPDDEWRWYCSTCEFMRLTKVETERRKEKAQRKRRTTTPPPWIHGR